MKRKRRRVLAAGVAASAPLALLIGACLVDWRCVGSQVLSRFARIGVIGSKSSRAVGIGWVAWSVDGKRLVFVRNVSKWTIAASFGGAGAWGEGTIDLWAVPAAGGKATKLAVVESGLHCTGPLPGPGPPVACSPTRPVVLYRRVARGAKGFYQLRVRALDDKQDVLVWTGDSSLYAWGPLGTRVLVLDDSQAKEHWRWHVVPAQGGPSLDLTAAVREAADPSRGGASAHARWGRTDDIVWVIDSPADGRPHEVWRVDLDPLRATRIAVHPVDHLGRSDIWRSMKEELAPGELERGTTRSPDRVARAVVEQWGVFNRTSLIAHFSPDRSRIAVGQTFVHTGTQKPGAYIYVCSPDGKERTLVWSELSDIK